jgi:NRPS condensation-like uncharacterized protein
MRRWTDPIWFLILLLILSGCGKGKETAVPAEEKQQEIKKAEEVQKADTTDDMKGLTMEAIQKEGKMTEVAPGTVQISSERQQLIGVKIGTAEMKSLEKVIRTVGRFDYDEKRIGTVSPKIGGWIEDL